ncbi:MULTISPECIES: TolC family protein [Nitrospirillum]|uniref:Cobalt-zinc-cadmium efflux system outer membrane protein n=1 Tax=Nitrospirillum amazonense TaxID=28077 RepID=A0A560FN08_9PROT|nr:TolC family protein [Nitrospirillum amazonense]MEC4589868.1 TolC family protein [Nitrospirillum amazonense]TWB22995.1 cobalt-zinc-cadmium efflux system outer membrane protein [Nitrospirillum amazonense]
MTVSKWLTPLMMAGALAGCATVPPEAGFPDVQKQLEARVPQRVAWNRDAAADAQAGQAVAELLARPLTADGAVQVALLNNPGLQATYEDLGVAQADLVQAGLLRNPILSLATEFPTKGAEPPKLEFSVVANFLDLLWLPARRQVAADRFEQVKLTVSAEVVELAAQTRAAYLRHRAALEEAQTLAQALDAAQAAYDLMVRLNQAGNVSERRLATEQAALEETRVDSMETAAEVTATRETLTRLMGLWGPQAQWSVAGDLPPLPPEEPGLATVENAVIAGNLKLDAARRTTAAKASALGLADASRLWTDGELGVAGERETDRSLVIGPSLTLALPLFDQGQPAVAKAEAEYRQEARRTLQLAVDLRSEAREARDRLVRARDLADHYLHTVLPLQDRLVRLGMAEYNYMLTSPFEVMAARQARLTAYRRYITAVRDYWLADGDLIRLAGGRQTISQPIPNEAPQPGGPS